MKFPKFFKNKTAGASSSYSSSDSGSGTPKCSPGNRFTFNHVCHGTTNSRKVVNTDKVLRVLGVDSKEDIQRINALQSEQIDDSPDTSFEDDALQDRKQEFLKDAYYVCGRRPSNGYMDDHKDDQEERRKSDFSVDHSYESRSSPSPSSPFMTTPPHSPRAQTPGSSPLGLPTPKTEVFRVRAPSPLPLPPRGCEVYEDQARKFSPGSSPLPQRPTSPKQVPQSWEIVQELGRGSFGTVYKGMNKEDGSYFAVKVIRDSSALAEIQQEVTILSKLGHPNIVRYLGSCFDKNGELCIFLELMMNSLKSVLVRLGKGFEENTIRNYVRQLLYGLVYLHEHNTIHRDIKCANILVNASGQVKLADFGVAKQTQLASSVKGSPFYMAPEMISPIPQNRSYGTPVDIWSLGCTVLEMANGKEPWSDMPGFAFFFKIAKGQLPPIPDHLSNSAKDFIQLCLRFRPEERPTAAKLLQHRFLAETPSTSAYVSPLASPRHSFLHEQQQHMIQGLRRNGNLNLVNGNLNSFNNSSNISATLLYRDQQVIIRSPHNLEALERDFNSMLRQSKK